MERSYKQEPLSLKSSIECEEERDMMFRALDEDEEVGHSFLPEVDLVTNVLTKNNHYPCPY